MCNIYRVTEEVLRYDTAPARRRRILEAVRSSGFVSVVELASRLGVSDMTIRRDLRKLQQQGEVTIVRGGVHLRPDPGFERRSHANALAKQRVADAACQLIADTDTIAIDAGTTTCALADSLPETFSGSVVTHSIPVLQHFVANATTPVVGLGGDLYPPSKAFVGPMTVDAALYLRVRTFFLGAAAADERGLYVASDIERPTKHALMEIADQVVLLADHTKFSKSAPVLLCRLDQLTAVVTDQQPPEPVCARLAEHNVRLLVADARSGPELVHRC